MMTEEEQAKTKAVALPEQQAATMTKDCVGVATTTTSRTLAQVVMRYCKTNKLSKETSNDDEQKGQRSVETLIQEEADILLRPSNKSWNDFDHSQQAKFAYLSLRNQLKIMKHQLSLILNNESIKSNNKTKKDNDDQTTTPAKQEEEEAPFDIDYEISKAILSSLDLAHEYGQWLEMFFKDETTVEHDQTTEGTCPYLETLYGLEGQDVWRDYDRAPTIFNNPTTSTNQKSRSFAFMTTQSVSSSNNDGWCHRDLVVLAEAIFYNKRNENDLSHEENIDRYSLNVNRYMQNNFIDEEIFDYIFVGRQNRYPDEKLFHILTPFYRKNAL